MKKPLFTLFIFAYCIIASAQTWLPVGNGVNGIIYTLFTHDSVMYAGGSFTTPGNNIAQWNGSDWDSLSSGTNNTVYAIGMYKDTVYMGGYFSKAGGRSAGNIAKWNGKSFAGAGFSVEAGTVNVIHAYDSLLYVGGSFDSVNHKRPSGLATWDGKKTDSVFITFPYLSNGDWENVSNLTTYKNLLFMGFAPVYGNGLSVPTWSNGTITYTGNDYFYSYSPTTVDIYMNAFCQADTNLYVGGSFLYFEQKYIAHPDTNKYTVNNIAMWNGHKWSGVGKGIHGMVNALVAYKNLIIAGGSFDSAGGVPVNNIAAWDGTKWSALGNGISGTVCALAVFDSNLYAGGSFTSPGNSIVEFDPNTKITPTLILNNDSVNVFPNPNNGQFTVVCNRIITSSGQPIIEVYNLLGEKVYSANLTDGNTTISIENLNPGMYLYRITASNGNLVTPGKLYIQ